jgi:hypothetical protein
MVDVIFMVRLLFGDAKAARAIRVPLRYTIDIISIDVDISDVDYTGEGFSIYGEEKITGGHSHLAHHDEGLASRCALCASAHPVGGPG